MVAGIVFISCADRQARHPVTKKTSTFLKESAKKNKALLASEEALIDSIIKKDTLHTFIDSQHVNAAGGRFDGTMEEAVTYFKQVLPDFIHKNI